ASAGIRAGAIFVFPTGDRSSVRCRLAIPTPHVRFSRRPPSRMSGKGLEVRVEIRSGRQFRRSCLVLREQRPQVCASGDLFTDSVQVLGKVPRKPTTVYPTHDGIERDGFPVGRRRPEPASTGEEVIQALRFLKQPFEVRFIVTSSLHILLYFPALVTGELSEEPDLLLDVHVRIPERIRGLVLHVRPCDTTIDT